MRRVTVGMALMVLLAAAVFLAGEQPQKPASPPSAYKVQEQRLGHLDRCILSPDYSFGRDGRRFAYVTRRNAKCVVVVDGQPGPQYDAVHGWPIFGPRGERLAYAAWKGGKCFAVVDGREGPRYDGVTWP